MVDEGNDRYKTDVSRVVCTCRACHDPVMHVMHVMLRIVQTVRRFAVHAPDSSDFPSIRDAG